MQQKKCNKQIWNNGNISTHTTCERELWWYNLLILYISLMSGLSLLLVCSFS